MNLAKVSGHFNDAKQLFQAIFLEFLKYEKDSFQSSSSASASSTPQDFLISKDSLMKVDIVESDILIVIIVNRTKDPNPLILSSKLSRLLFDSATFPFELAPGSLKDIVLKEELSVFLSKLKAILVASSGTVVTDEKSVLTEEKQPPQHQHQPLQHQPPQYHQDHSHMQIHPQSSVFEVGRSDLDPFSAAPGLGGYPTPAFPNSGGMIVGPGHPMFTNPSPGDYGRPFPMGPGSLPMGSVPPGARFDPISPFGPQPGFPAGPSSSRPPGRRPPFGGDPDNDAFYPPGGNSYF